MNFTGRRRGSPDSVLSSVVLALLTLGIVMVYSTSAIFADQKFGRPWYFFVHQMIFTVVALLGMAVADSVDYSRLRRWRWAMLAAVCVALAAVFRCGAVGGAHRWIHWGGVGIQPSEFAKFVSVLFLADYLDRRSRRLGTLRGSAIPLGVVALLLLLIGMEPDLGTPILMFLVAVLMLFIAGAPLRGLAWALALGIPVVIEEFIREPYRIQRLQTWLHHADNVKGAGSQSAQAVLAIGAGGIFGKGLGASEIKLLYLPAAHTDYIFPVLCEESGLCGAAILISLFVIFLLRGFRIARAAPDRFGALLAAGITLTIFLQTILNLSMATGLLPTKGIGLPFISFGGSSLVATCLACGVLLNISRQSGREE